MAWKQGNHMEERKEKGTWIGDLLARIVFQTGTGLCALMLGILVPVFEVYAGEQGCQWGYQQEQKQEQHMQLSDEADNYLAVMLEDYDFTGLDEELAVYFPDLSIHADGIMKMLLDGKVQEVCVDMGAPILKPEEIPVDVQAAEAAGEERLVNWQIQVNGTQYHMTCVSMGNPHCIVPVEDPGKLIIGEIGPKFENHPAFPDRVNTEFIRVLDRKTVEMRVWERGSGETLACGTGACAVAVACILNGWTEDEVTVKLLGGPLRIRWNREKNTVFMTGSATVVFDGEITL